MENFLQNNKARAYTLAVFTAAAILALGILIGSYLTRRSLKTVEEQEPGMVSGELYNNSEANDIVPEKEIRYEIPYNSAIQKTTFLKCGHVIENKISDGAVTKAELEQNYPGHSMIIRNGEQAILHREVDDYCPKHFILTLRGDNLTVEQYDAGTGERGILNTVEAELSAIPASIQDEMKAGLPFEELAQIDEYMENVES